MQNKTNPETINSFCHYTRRNFLGSCVTCIAGMAVLSPLGISAFATPAPLAQNKGKTKIKLLFAYPDPKQPNWPNIGYDFNGRIQQLKKMFASQCPDIDFSPVLVESGDAEVATGIINADPDVDGYVVYLVCCLWGDMSETIAASGKPTIFIDELFAGSGEFLTSYARVKRQGHKVIAVSSSQFKDVVDAVHCIDSLTKMRQSTILVVGANADEKIKEVYGTTVKKIEFAEINETYKKVNSTEAKKWAERWINEAEKVIEPPRTEIEKSAAMYLAMIDLLQRHNAQAIAINCLSGIYNGNMVEAYPCLGFMQLDNDGKVGACEADQRSTITKLLISYLVGRPGFISDPVIDTAKNRIIYAHCVGPTKVFGVDGTANAYHIRNHSEDRKGACNRSLMPLGEMTTTIKLDHNKNQIIFHQATTVENVDDDKACRTKLAAEVKGDVYKLLNLWDEWGWHRVTFFGDLKRPVYNIAALLGFEVIEEA